MRQLSSGTPLFARFNINMVEMVPPWGSRRYYKITKHSFCNFSATRPLSSKKFGDTVQ